MSFTIKNCSALQLKMDERKEESQREGRRIRESIHSHRNLPSVYCITVSALGTVCEGRWSNIFP